MQLERALPKIQQKGLGLVAISYDSPAILKNFSARRKISFPLLADEGSRIIGKFGILNQTIAKQDPFFGIPNPGTYLVDAKGVVTAKFFEDDYKDRDSAASILLREFAISPESDHLNFHGKHLSVSTSASDVSVQFGRKITLILDLELPPNVHVYAPGVKGYIPIDWTMRPFERARVGPAVYPKSILLHLDFVDETVPVFENRFRITRQVVIGNASPGELELDGDLRYQACDKVCYIPETIPVKWRLHVEALDKERAPDAMRHK